MLGTSKSLESKSERLWRLGERPGGVSDLLETAAGFLSGRALQEAGESHLRGPLAHLVRTGKGRTGGTCTRGTALDQQRRAVRVWC